MHSNWRGLPKAFGVLLAVMLLIGVLLLVKPGWLMFG
jgi:hypothetical protein